jgi:hypothetical protein
MKKKPFGYWNIKENCLNEAKKFTNKTQWMIKSSGSYKSAERNNWIKECIEHMTPLGGHFRKMVYCFVFPDKSVYVGITGNENRRKNEHLTKTYFNTHNSKVTAVMNHIKKTNLTPKYKKITDYIPAIESQKIESLVIEKYRKKGYNILNVARAGSLGSIKIIPKKETCIEDAKKYNLKSKWVEKSRALCEISKLHGWYEECISHMEKPFIWTKELCVESAKKYKNIITWRKNCWTAYTISRKNKWLDECTIHMKKNIKWTKELCMEDAKKYNARGEWQKKSPSAYVTSRKNKWLDECFPPKIRIEV